MNYEIEEFTVEDICKRWTDGQLKVDHEYQRAPRWIDRQKQLLIDSVLRGYALPLFFLHRKKRGFGHQTIEEWFIVDGQQRIQSLADYKAGSFGLLDPSKKPEVVSQVHSRFRSAMRMGEPSLRSTRPITARGLQLNEATGHLDRCRRGRSERPFREVASGFSAQTSG